MNGFLSPTGLCWLVVGLLSSSAITMIASQACTREASTVRCKQTTEDMDAKQIWTELESPQLDRGTIETLMFGNDSCQPAGSCVEVRTVLSVSNTALAGLTALKYLYLQNSKLVCSSATDSNCDFFKPLSTASRGLELLSIKHVDGLDKLYSFNPLSFRDPWKLDSVTTLTVDDTDSGSLGNLLWRFSQVRLVTFTNNCAPTIGSTFLPTDNPLPAMTSLNVSRTRPVLCGEASDKPVKIYPAFLKALPNLQRFAAAGLKMQTAVAVDPVGPISEIINNFTTSLTDLDLSNNGLLNLDGILLKLPNLNSLNASNNPSLFSMANKNISSLGVPATGALRILRLANTSLTVVQVDLLTFYPRLQIIDVRSNQLKYFPNAVTENLMTFGRNPETQELLLQGNSGLICNCNVSALIHWVSPTFNHQPAWQPILCAGVDTRFQDCPPKCMYTPSTPNAVASWVQMNSTNVQDVLNGNCPAIYKHNENGAIRGVVNGWSLPVGAVVWALVKFFDL